MDCGPGFERDHETQIRAEIEDLANDKTWGWASQATSTYTILVQSASLYWTGSSQGGLSWASKCLFEQRHGLLKDQQDQVHPYYIQNCQ